MFGLGCNNMDNDGQWIMSVTGIKGIYVAVHEDLNMATATHTCKLGV